jgi:prepilin-type N-terminal cleavage/methylation domain-containing protein
MSMRRTAFTLLEVMIAVAILAGALTALVHAQATAVMMTLETEKLLVATMLAKEKMAEVQLMMESEGFGEQDIEEEGDFDDFGDMEGLDLNLDVDDAYEDFHWAYTVRRIELELGGDMSGMAEGLAGQGYWGEQDYDQSSQHGQGSSSGRDGQQDTPGLDDMGVSSDMITELLGGYIREVRVLVWWGDNEDELDQVEITTHVINSAALQLMSGAMGGSSGGRSGGKSGGSSRGGVQGANPGSSGGSSGKSGGGSSTRIPGTGYSLPTGRN